MDPADRAVEAFERAGELFEAGELDAALAVGEQALALFEPLDDAEPDVVNVHPDTIACEQNLAALREESSG